MGTAVINGDKVIGKRRQEYIRCRGNVVSECRGNRVFYLERDQDQDQLLDLVLFGIWN
jgi:hypothetical protein